MPVTNYIWDDENDSLLMETDENDNTTAVYTNEPDQYGRVISQRRGNDTSYYHFDAIGSTRQLTNAAEVVTDTYLYDSFGVPLAISGSAPNSLRFGGEFGYLIDLVLSQYHVRARVYLPSIGRWSSLDPAAFVDALHRFLYVHNNPTRSIDPSGQITVTPSRQRLDDVTCGSPNEQVLNKAVIIWDFELDDEAPCNGYIIQKVTVRCEINDCVRCPEFTHVKPSATYYEAWKVKKGDTFHKLHSMIPYTDVATAQAVDGTCGNVSQYGLIKFLCESTTGDLGDFGKPSPDGTWTIAAKYGEGRCQLNVGGIPSRTDPPNGWNDKSTEKPATRWFGMWWNCCPCQNKFVWADADPKSTK